MKDSTRVSATRRILPLQPIAPAPTDDRRPHWYDGDAADWHVFRTAGQSYVYVPDGSRIFAIQDAAATLLERLSGQPLVSALDVIGIKPVLAVTDQRPASVPIRSLSLAVAQRCNLACTYCYAQEGRFGGEERLMPLEVAHTAIEKLIGTAPPATRVNLAFMGGEPLLNRRVIRAATRYAAELAERHAVSLGLAITTNGTLVTPEDGRFFEDYGFTVTVSLDGVDEDHDRQRPFRNGRGSFETVLANVRPLLAAQQHMQVSARVTVTPRNLELTRTLDALIQLGFHSVGFSPVLAAPSGRDEMAAAHLRVLLEEMIECGRRFEAQVLAGRRYPFANSIAAMRELHRGTHRPYPCGAGAGYLGVSAAGELSACHRFVDDPAGSMGNLETGIDEIRQAQWLEERHVHRQEPCRSCWARYLCGGGCHHEVIHRGRPACDYIRGWLHYCLEAYARLRLERPEYFESDS